MKNALKRSLSLLLAITIIFGSAYAGLGEVSFGVITDASYETGLYDCFSYYIDEDAGKAVIYDCADYVKGTVVVPGYIEGYPVSIGVNDSAYCEVFTDSKYITKVIISEGVETIGFGSFSWNENITEIVIPETIKCIADFAFYGCTNLAKLNIPENIESVYAYAFYGTAIWNDEDNWYDDCLYYDNCLVFVFPDYAESTLYVKEGTRVIGTWSIDTNYINEIVLPDSVVTICDNLTTYGISFSQVRKINIPKNVSYIGDCFLDTCLPKSIVVDEANKYYTMYNGYLCDKALTKVIRATEEALTPVIGDDGEILEKEFSMTIPDCFTEICSGAIMNLDSCDSIIIPSSIKSIGYRAFSFISGSSEITIPESVEYLDDAVFECSSFSKINILADIEEFGYGVFLQCNNLKTLIIPDTVKVIGDSTFYMCENLESIIIPNNVTIIENNAFYKCINLESIIIPDGVTTIGLEAFYGCEKLDFVTIPDSVTDIGFYVFNKTAYYNDANNWENGVLYIGKHLIDVDEALSGSYKIKDGTKTIAASSFDFCSKITAITIPKSVTSIGYASFDGCNNLSKVKYEGTREEWENIFIDEFNENLIRAYESQFVPPTTPKLSSVTRVSNGVKITWSKVTNADEYIVYRKTSKSGWSRLGVVEGTSFTDKTAKTGSTYYYTVKAQNEAGASGYNKTGLKIKYVAAPKLTKIANEASGVRVYWSKISGADGYYLYRRVAGTKSWTKIATIKKGTTTSYKDTKASAGKTYEYIIKAYDGSTPSAAAAKVIKIKRLTVPKLVSTSSSKTGITVKWGKVAGAEGYYVYRKTGSGSWVKVATVKGNTKVSFVDKTAKKGTTYTYTVKAYSGSYTSSYNTKGLKIKDKY